MREEPVITKEAFVREEVIVRKTVQERTETVRDTVRRTDFELEELSEQRGS
jgi:stress response protein YsnF